MDFCDNMVRIIAGVLVRVGRGFYEPEKVKELLEGGERTRKRSRHRRRDSA